jgi:hypothetical protein
LPLCTVFKNVDESSLRTAPCLTAAAFNQAMFRAMASNLQEKFTSNPEPYRVRKIPIWSAGDACSGNSDERERSDEQQVDQREQGRSDTGGNQDVIGPEIRLEVE